MIASAVSWVVQQDSGTTTVHASPSGKGRALIIRPSSTKPMEMLPSDFGSVSHRRASSSSERSLV